MCIYTRILGPRIRAALRTTHVFINVSHCFPLQIVSKKTFQVVERLEGVASFSPRNQHKCSRLETLAPKITITKLITARHPPARGKSLPPHAPSPPEGMLQIDRK